MVNDKQAIRGRTKGYFDINYILTFLDSPLKIDIISKFSLFFYVRTLRNKMRVENSITPAISKANRCSLVPQTLREYPFHKDSGVPDISHCYCVSKKPIGILYRGQVFNVYSSTNLFWVMKLMICRWALNFGFSALYLNSDLLALVVELEVDINGSSEALGLLPWIQWNSFPCKHLPWSSRLPE